jgi:hypothetical protein
MAPKLTRVSARTCLNDAVTITICEQPETGQRSWHIYDDCRSNSNSLNGLDFVEPKVPRIVRQLYGVMVGSGAHQTVLSGASIIQHLTRCGILRTDRSRWRLRTLRDGGGWLR